MPVSTGSAAVVSGGVSSYRRPRRRPAHLRTKTGCLTCRKRKKKCDETPQTCRNCARQSLECTWQLNRQHSVSDDLSDHSSLGETLRVSSPVVAETELGMIQLFSDTKAQLSVSHLFSLIPQQGLVCCPQTGSIDLSIEQRYFVTSGHSPAITPGSAPLLDFLRSRFLPQLIRPAASCRIIDFFSKESMAMATSTPACMHALLACSGAEMPTKTPRVRDLAKFHYVQAVKDLRNDLERRDVQSRWLVVMHTVLMLCIYERSKPQGSASVQVHLNGAAQLIQLASIHCKSSHDSSNIEQAMYRLVYEAFIFHVATSLPFQYHMKDSSEVDSAFALAEDNLERHFNSSLACYPDSPVLGAPPQLFRYTYTVYHLYQDYLRGSLDLGALRKLENDLLQWDQSTAAPNTYKPDGMQDNLKKYDLGPWHRVIWKSQAAVIGPRLYLLGCRILLQLMAYGNKRRAHSTVDRLVQEGMNAVKHLQPELDYFAEYYCWPFYVLGISLQHLADRECLMAQILAFYEATNNGTMRRLSEILSARWKSSQSVLPG